VPHETTDRFQPYGQDPPHVGNENLTDKTSRRYADPDNGRSSVVAGCRRLRVHGVARVPSRSDRCPVGCVGATPCLPPDSWLMPRPHSTRNPRHGAQPAQVGLRWPTSARACPGRRATRMPYRRVNHGIERTTTVTAIRPFSWSSSLDQLERIPGMCLVRMRSQVQGRSWGGRPRPARPCGRKSF
jgi:hypothetical protein